MPRRKRTRNKSDSTAGGDSDRSHDDFVDSTSMSTMMDLSRAYCGQLDEEQSTYNPPVDEDGEEIYIVEKILNKRIVDGKIQYYLKWQGYGP